jgi:hypothetical protein
MRTLLQGQKIEKTLSKKLISIFTSISDNNYQITYKLYTSNTQLQGQKIEKTLSKKLISIFTSISDNIN